MVMEGFNEYKSTNGKKLDKDTSVLESKGQGKIFRKKCEVSIIEE